MPCQRSWVLTQRSHGYPRRTFDQQVLAFHDLTHGRGDFRLAHQDVLVHQRLAERKGDGPRLDAPGGPVGECGQRRHVDDGTALDRDGHDRRVLRQTADDMDGGIVGLEHCCNAADQPATADGNEHDLDSRQLLDNLDADGALSGHHVQVVVGRKIRQAVLIRIAARLQFADQAVVAMQAHLDPIAAHGFQLRRRSMLRHEDGALYTQRPAAVGYGRAVVARRGGNNPAQTLLGCK